MTLLALISTMVVGYVIAAFGLGIDSIGDVIALFVVGYAFIWFPVEDGPRLTYDRFDKQWS